MPGCSTRLEPDLRPGGRTCGVALRQGDREDDEWSHNPVRRVCLTRARNTPTVVGRGKETPGQSVGIGFIDDMEGCSDGDFGS